MPKSSLPRQPERDLRRKRTAMSCDTCKSRKTKCIEPVPGPCTYCASISASCTITIKRKPRPFYTVSEEEYRYGIEILQKFVPDVDLNIDTLRQLAQGTWRKETEREAAGTKQYEAGAGSELCGESSSCEQISSSAISVPAAAEPVLGVEELDNLPSQFLTQKRGRLIIDLSGTTRYVGPQSDVFFISAVRSYAQGESVRSAVGPSDHPLRFSSRSPISPENKSSIVEQFKPTYLPPRNDWVMHIDRYFKEVNSTYWLISSESFCGRLDDTYATYPPDPKDCSKSWMCFLYSVLALTSQTLDPSSVQQRPALGCAANALTADDYISIAKMLLNDILDEANLDSIRALCAMSIFMFNQGFPVPSYLYIGAAVRISYTLGMHQPQSYEEMTTLQKDNALRIAWTLYQVDSEISRPPGRPANVDEASWRPLMPSESSTGSCVYDPWGLINFSISFSLEDHQVFDKLTNLLRTSNHEAINRGIQDCVTSLQAWYQTLPPHLQWDAPVAPPHRRPICLLHLRYWNSILFSTRYALLRDIQCLHASPLTTGAEPALSTHGQLCVDACEKSRQILEMMHSSNILSSLTAVDAKHIMDIFMISLMTIMLWPDSRLQQCLDQCTFLLQSMDSIGWCAFGQADLASLVGKYQSRARGIRDKNDDDVVETEAEPLEVTSQPEVGDFGWECFWSQDVSRPILDWGFVPWEISLGAGSQPQGP